MLFGVAGGLARYLNVDVSIVRIVWALLVIAGGAGILLYIVAAIVIPEEPSGYAPPAGDASGATSGAGFAGGVDRSPNTRTDMGNAPIVFGVVLVLIGAWLLVDRFIDINTRDLWPIVVIVLGLVLVGGALRRR